MFASGRVRRSPNVPNSERPLALLPPSGPPPLQVFAGRTCAVAARRLRASYWQPSTERPRRQLFARASSHESQGLGSIHGSARCDLLSQRTPAACGPVESGCASTISITVINLHVFLRLHALSSSFCSTRRLRPHRSSRGVIGAPAVFVLLRKHLMDLGLWMLDPVSAPRITTVLERCGYQAHHSDSCSQSWGEVLSRRRNVDVCHTSPGSQRVLFVLAEDLTSDLNNVSDCFSVPSAVLFLSYSGQD